MSKDSMIEELEELQEPIDTFFEMNAKNDLLLDSKQSIEAMNNRLKQISQTDDDDTRKK